MGWTGCSDTTVGGRILGALWFECLTDRRKIPILPIPGRHLFPILLIVLLNHICYVASKFFGWYGGTVERCTARQLVSLVLCWICLTAGTAKRWPIYPGTTNHCLIKFLLGTSNSRWSDQTPTHFWFITFLFLLLFLLLRQRELVVKLEHLRHFRIGRVVVHLIGEETLQKAGTVS
jgi:hypothetical protein